MFFTNAKPIWMNNQEKELNSNCCFKASFKKAFNMSLHITGSSSYKVYLNGKLLCVGPARAAHGFFRVDEIPLNDLNDINYLYIIAAGYNTFSYWLVNQPAFLQAEIFSENTSVIYTGRDFLVRNYNERIRKVSRFSYQRTFSEIYNFLNNDNADFIEPSIVNGGKLLNRNVSYPTYELINSLLIEAGSFIIENKTPIENTWLNIKALKVFPLEEIKDVPANDVQLFTYYKGEIKNNLKEKEYAVFDLKHAETGFIKITCEVKEKATLYVIFDEMNINYNNPALPIDVKFDRNGCVNIIKYYANKGSFTHSSYEPYTARFVKVVVESGEILSLNIQLIKYENPDTNRYLACNGGNVIAMQIENEYGSYSNDKSYMNYLKKALIKRHMDVILFTSDGTLPSMIAAGSIKNTLAAMNFGSNAKNSFDLIKKINPNYPLFCGELWIGWFDQYYKEKKRRDVDSVITEINDLLKMNASFNVYMFIGGTNFNFTAGANYFDKYYATTTSYDYNALLNEHGGYTPLYFAIRELLLKKQNLKSLPLPMDVKLQKINDLKPSFYASLFDNYKKIAKKHYSKLPHNIEYYNQDYGYIIYEVKINDDYQATRLLIEDVNDIAYVYINNEFIVKFDSLNSKTNTHSFELGPLKKNSVIKIFVDCMGRINYGHKLKNTKGIKSVILGSQILTNFKVYSLDMRDLTNLEYKELKNKSKLSYPCFFKYNFKATSTLDTYISILNLKKGFIKVNDFNIGRYYNVIPQEKIYLPGALLKNENEIIVFEEEKIKDLVLKFIDE